jgi:hypothetical protein
MADLKYRLPLRLFRGIVTQTLPWYRSFRISSGIPLFPAAIRFRAIRINTGSLNVCALANNSSELPFRFAPFSFSSVC